MSFWLEDGLGKLLGLIDTSYHIGVHTCTFSTYRYMYLLFEIYCERVVRPASLWFLNQFVQRAPADCNYFKVGLRAALCFRLFCFCE